MQRRHPVLAARGGLAATAKAPAEGPAIARMTAIGAKVPAKVAINEVTTIASD